MVDKKNQTASGLELVMMRNTFYRDHYRRALLALLLLFAINVVLCGAIVYKWMTPPAPQYFAAMPDGRMINWHPLSDPSVTDDYVLQWSANAVREAFSQDFIHWRKQLQTASSKFTPEGWKYFLAAMKKSNNLKTLVNLKMVSNATITGSPVIVEKEIVGGTKGRYAWKIRMPILVTYTNKDRTIPMPMDITLIVIRVPVQQDPDRIAINNFLPVPAKKTVAQQILNT